jgi:hypothetical protein
LNSSILVKKILGISIIFKSISAKVFQFFIKEMHTINISSDKIFTTDGLTIYTFSNVMLKKYNVFTDSLLVMLDILIIRDACMLSEAKTSLI